MRNYLCQGFLAGGHGRVRPFHGNRRSTSPAPARRFPYPIYAKWAEAYKKKTGIGMNYQSIGSGGGIKQITAKTVDFGASDMPMKPEDLDKDGLMQFPTIMGGVVPVVNLEGVEAGRAQADRRRCSPTSTSARSRSGTTPAIAKLNPGVKLPDQAITVVHRSDGSGTTFICVPTTCRR